MGECHWAVAFPVDAPKLGQQTVAGPLRQQLLVRLLAELLIATLLQWLLQPALLLPWQQLPVAPSAPRTNDLVYGVAAVVFATFESVFEAAPERSFVAQIQREKSLIAVL